VRSSNEKAILGGRTRRDATEDVEESYTKRILETQHVVHIVFDPLKIQPNVLLLAQRRKNAKSSPSFQGHDHTSRPLACAKSKPIRAVVMTQGRLELPTFSVLD
jgi:hypothetical protein